MMPTAEGPVCLALIPIAGPNTEAGAGKVRDYALSPAPPTPDGPAFALRNLATGGEYRVSRFQGRWACSCPDYRHRSGKRGVDCKHVGPVRTYWEAHMSEEKAPEARAEPEAPTPHADDLGPLLAAPFDPEEVKWKAQVVSGNRALAVAYVDARAVQDRLDEVLGVVGWQDAYELQPDGAVACTLSIRCGADWVSKTDVGAPSEQPDEGDRKKAAYSDALKRAAVKFGVGRYLYRLGAVWVDYDPQKKRIVSPPDLPAEALPQAQRPRKEPPKDGAALFRRLSYRDQMLAKEGRCHEGDLLAFVAARSPRKGPVQDWAPPYEDVMMFARDFQRQDRPLCPRELELLDAQLRRKGARWPDLCARVGLPATAGPLDLTLTKAQAMWKALATMPDKAA
jgi:hypothetical protein